MQEIIAYTGKDYCYEESSHLIKEMTGVEVSPSQIYRVTDNIAGSIKEDNTRQLAPLKKDECLYIEADGSMIHTREDSWKEVKLGRIFNSSECIKATEETSYIGHSQYVSHLGSSTDFCEKMEEIIDFTTNSKQFIFISDGATWIRNWIEKSYDKSISILDYYHACEHLHEFATLQFSDLQQKDLWCKTQKELLLNSKVLDVLSNIQILEGNEAAKKKLTEYYKSNINRMDYKYYRTLGCGIIGSGAIESAHRTVIQKRMKLSGQRWSKKGAANMLKLRTVFMNKQWNIVVNYLKSTA